MMRKEKQSEIKINIEANRYRLGYLIIHKSYDNDYWWMPEIKALFFSDLTLSDNLHHVQFLKSFLFTPFVGLTRFAIN